MSLSALIVDEDVALLDALKLALTPHCTTVLTASTLNFAAKLLQMEAPDIIVCEAEFKAFPAMRVTTQLRALKSDAEIILHVQQLKSTYLPAALSQNIFGCAIKNSVHSELLQLFSQAVKKRVGDIEQRKLQTFNHYCSDESDMLMMVCKDHVTVHLNKRFLEYFDVKTLDEFCQKHGEPSDLIRDYLDFRFEGSLIKRLRESQYHSETLLIPNLSGNSTRFVISLHRIQNNKRFALVTLSACNQYIKSLCSHSLDQQVNVSDATVFDTFKEIKQKEKEVVFHNFYKGINITNSGSVIEVYQDKVALKTSQAQLNAIEHAGKFIVHHDLFPFYLVCEKVLNIDYKNSQLIAKAFRFLPKHPLQRKTMRLCVENEGSSATFKEKRIVIEEAQNVAVTDISNCSVKVEVKALPLAFITKKTLMIQLRLLHDENLFEVTAYGSMLRYYDSEECFFAIFKIQLDPSNRARLERFIKKRETALVQAFNSGLVEQLKKMKRV